jgi:hypothetical protein
MISVSFLFFKMILISFLFFKMILISKLISNFYVATYVYLILLIPFCMHAGEHHQGHH